MIDLILEALKTQAAADTLGYFGAWVLSPFLAFAYVQFAKRDRIEKGAPKLSAARLRMLASGSSFLFVLFFANRLAGWPLDRAVTHAIGVAICYPLLMVFYFSRLKRLEPDTAGEMGGNDATELQMGPEDRKP